MPSSYPSQLDGEMLPLDEVNGRVGKKVIHTLINWQLKDVGLLRYV